MSIAGHCCLALMRMLFGCLVSRRYGDGTARDGAALYLRPVVIVIVIRTLPLQYIRNGEH